MDSQPPHKPGTQATPLRNEEQEQQPVLSEIFCGERRQLVAIGCYPFEVMPSIVLAPAYNVRFHATRVPAFRFLLSNPHPEPET